MTKAVLAFLISLAAVTPSPAQEDVGAFYRGKTLRLVVGVETMARVRAALEQR